MGVQDAIRDADALLPGEPSEDGQDPRWQAIIRVGGYIPDDPAPVRDFAHRWGAHPQDDLPDAIATCLLEHLLEHHFASYLPRVEPAAMSDRLFADTFQRRWQFGQAEQPDDAERFRSLNARSEERWRGA